MASKNIPVNGWPQLKDLEAVQPTLDRLDKIEAWKRTVKEETFTGDDFIIPNALKLPARSLKTTIEAIQDLHGLPFPYVGGAYKNKLPMTVSAIKAANTGGTWSGNAYTYRGIVYTLLTDAADNITGINVDGNNTGTTSSDLWIPVNQTIDGILNGCPTGGSVSTYLQTVWSDQGGHVASDTGSGVSVADIAITNMSIRVRNGVAISNKVFYPMIRLSTESDASFAPWENKCPISGRTEARVDTENEDSTESAYAVIQLGTTVYGADINWDTGVMTVTDATHACTGEETVSTISASYPNFFIIEDLNNAFMRDFRVRISSNIFEIPQVSHYNGIEYADPNSIVDGSSICYVGGGGNTIGFKALGISSASDFKAFLLAQYTANTPVTFRLPLATPTTIQLTPTQLQMLKGYNRVTLADGYGTIELKALTGANWS